MGDEFMNTDEEHRQSGSGRNTAVLETRIQTTSQEPKYSTEILEAYDRERHITIPDALQMLQQNARDLNPAQLTSAMSKGDIHVYEFKGKQFIDRLDIGRVYHESKTPQGLTIERFFTDGRTDPYTTAGTFTRRNLKIKDNDTGRTKFEMNDAYFPEWMDNVSAQIVANKYFFKPHDTNLKEELKKRIGNEHESSLVHLVKRVTNFITDAGNEHGYFATEQDRETFREELAFLQINGMFAFNSPVQFNAGVFHEYGITGSRGMLYTRDPVTGKETRTESYFEHPQCHACFIKGPRDNLESISQQIVSSNSNELIANVMKRCSKSMIYFAQKVFIIIIIVVVVVIKLNFM